MQTKTSSFQKSEAETALLDIRMSQRKRRKEDLPLTTRQGALLLLVLTIFFVIVFYLVFHYVNLPGME